MSLDNFILECEKDNKNLEDTIKVLKNKIQRLTKENERLNGAIQTYNILLKSNIKENEELKSQLRGTTHCFDEEEHKKLKEEITNLSKDVDMWNVKYNDMFDENKELKKQLEEWKHHLKCSKEMLDIQGQKGNYDYDEYMLGLYNGMEYIISLFEKREPNYISGKDVEFTNNKTQQKEFIKYLENEIKLYENDIQNFKKDYKVYSLLINDLRVSKAKMEEILNKYKEIIGVSDENTIK